MIHRFAAAVVFPLIIAVAFVAAPVSRAAIGDDDDRKHQDHDHGGTIFDLAKKDGNLNTFTAAIAQAGIEEDFEHNEYTVFAPTDDAFARLATEKLDELLKPENKDKLRAVLMAHVVKGKLASAAVRDEPTRATSENGSALSIQKGEGGVITVNGATVVKADVEAKNGIIHAIDTVLIPEGTF